MSQLEMPLYQQIYDEIKHAIDNGIYVPGDKIPTETELSTKYAVSRITVRRAIEDLGAALYRTDTQGTIAVFSDGEHLEFAQEPSVHSDGPAP